MVLSGENVNLDQLKELEVELAARDLENRCLRNKNGLRKYFLGPFITLKSYLKASSHFHSANLVFSGPHVASGRRLLLQSRRFPLDQ